MLSRATARFLFAVIAASAVSMYTAAALVSGVTRTAALLPLAVVVGAALAVIALWRIEAFLLIVLVLRSSLDALKLDGGMVDPGAAVGLLLLGVVPLWLVLQHRSGAMRFRLTRTGAAVGAFSAAAALGIVVSPDPLASAVEWSRIAAAAAMFFGIEQICLHRPGYRRPVLIAVFLAVPVPLVAAFVQLQTGQGLFEAAGFSRVTGTFTHSNPFAAFLAIVIPVAVACGIHLRGRARLVPCLAAAAAAPFLLLTYTRGAWIAAAVGVAVVALLSRRFKVFLGLAALIAAAALLVPSVSDRVSTVPNIAQVAQLSEQQPAATHDSLAWRIRYWGESLGLAQQSPLAGIGLKQVSESLPDAKQPHNDFVRAYVELGVLGLITFGWLMAQLLLLGPRTAKLQRRRSAAEVQPSDRALAVGFAGAAAAYATLSISANLMSQPVVLLYLMALAGLTSAAASAVGDSPAGDTLGSAAPATDFAAAAP